VLFSPWFDRKMFKPVFMIVFRFHSEITFILSSS